MTLYDYAKSIGLSPNVALAIFVNCDGMVCSKCPLYPLDCSRDFNKARAKYGLVMPFEASALMLDRAKEIEVNIKNKE